MKSWSWFLPLAWVGLCVPGAVAQNLLWMFDEVGAPTRAYDASGHGNHGVVAGRVTSDAAGGLTGFVNHASHVTWQSGDRHLAHRGNTLLMWFKNPGLEPRTTLAGVGGLGNELRAWELWLGGPDGEGKRTLNLSWSSWEDKAGVLTSDRPVAFEPDTYYCLAFTWAGAGRYYPYTVHAYLAKDGAPGLGEALLSARVGHGGGPTSGGLFYVGATGGVDYGSFRSGCLGDGSIGTVALWIDGRLPDAAALNRLYLSSALRPEPAAAGLPVAGEAVARTEVSQSP